jgi:HSP20 family protein
MCRRDMVVGERSGSNEESIMASRTSGRGDERSSGRTASGGNAGTTRRQGAATQGSAANARQNDAANQSASQSGSGNRDTQPRRTEASSGIGESSVRGDQERELRTANEQGNMRPGASAQRGNVGREGRGYAAPSSGANNTPFALMRRMMEDMDRLFSDFGLTHPGMFGSSLSNAELWPSSRERSLGAASSGSSSAPATPRGQQSVQRGGQGSLQQSPFGSLWAPQVEVLERGNNLVVRADLPGLSREDVDVELDEDALIIRGERRSDVEDDNEGFYRSERSYGSFYRAIPLPQGIDASGCNATFKDGVLEVTLPKPPQQASRARRIDVRE